MNRGEGAIFLNKNLYHIDEREESSDEEADLKIDLEIHDDFRTLPGEILIKTNNCSYIHEVLLPYPTDQDKNYK